MLSDAFFVKLNEVSQRLGMNPRDLLLCIFLESNGNPASKYRGPGSSARGLLGFITSTLRNLGASKETASNFTNLSAEDQLPYVEKLVQSSQRLIGGKPFTSATQYEHANFYPATLYRWHGTDPNANANVVVAAKEAKSPGERQAYEVNKVIDSGKKGYISVGDLNRLLMGVQRRPGFQAALKRLNEVAGPGTVSEMTKQKTDSPKQEGSDLVDRFLNDLSKFIDRFGSEDNMNGTLISIGAKDFTDKIEFARVLSIALKEELNAESSIHTNEDTVEMICPNSDSQKVAQVCLELSEAFKSATKKLGGVEIITIVSSNSSPHHSQLGIKVAEMHYDLFRSKFARGQ